MEKGYFSELSPKVKMALLSLIDDFYSIEKQHTVVVMPFFGLLHPQGNESKPFLNYTDINILDLMKSQFRDVIVYPGENRYLNSYDLSLQSVEHLANEQNLLSRIINKTTDFDKISSVHKEILDMYGKAITHFDETKQQHPLPYKMATNIQTPEDLIKFVVKLDKKIKQEDKENKICLICPISFLTEHTSDVYNSITDTIKSVGATLYFAQNQSDRYLYDTSYRLLYDEQYDEKFIQSIQDFANVYNKDITELAKVKLDFNTIVKRVKNGDYGFTENEIIDNLEGIDVKKLYSKRLSEAMECFIRIYCNRSAEEEARFCEIGQQLFERARKISHNNDNLLEDKNIWRK